MNHKLYRHNGFYQFGTLVQMVHGGAPACRRHFKLCRSICWTWQIQQKRLGKHGDLKGYFNCIFHPNCLSYDLTFLKTLSNSWTHCKIEFHNYPDSFFNCLWACSFFLILLLACGGSFTPSITKRSAFAVFPCLRPLTVCCLTFVSLNHCIFVIARM